jgi:hypothetical protein
MKSNLCRSPCHVRPLAGRRFTLRRDSNNINAANAAIGRLIKTVGGTRPLISHEAPTRQPGERNSQAHLQLRCFDPPSIGQLAGKITDMCSNMLTAKQPSEKRPCIASRGNAFVSRRYQMSGRTRCTPATAEALQVTLSACDHLARFFSSTSSDVIVHTELTIPPPPIPAIARKMHKVVKD